MPTASTVQTFVKRTPDWRARALRHVRHLRLDLSLAFKEVIRRKRRSGVAVIAVAFSVIALLLSSGFIHWILTSMREDAVHTVGHLQVTRPGYAESGLADPLSYLVPDRDTAPIGASVGAKTLAPRLSFSGLVSLGEATLSFQGEGLDPAAEGPLSQAMTIVSGAALSGTAGRKEVLLGAGLAENLGAKVGQKVVLLSSTATGGVNGVEAEISGIFATSTKAYDDVYLRVPLDLAKQLLRVEGTTRWIVLLDDTARTDAALATLRSRLPENEYAITPWYLLADFYNKTAMLFSKQLGFLNLIIAVIVVLTISNCMTIGVVERTGEIGTALAIGATQSVIRRRFIVEGLVLGVVGASLGLGLGLLAAQLISSVGIPMPPPPGADQGYLGQISVTPWLAVKAAAVGIVSALAGAVLPAVRASRMVIVDAIRQGK